MSDAPPMSLASKLQRRETVGDYPEALTAAERFVDDVTLLRMSRLRMPNGKPEIGGFDNDTIKHVHLAGARMEQWGKPEVEGVYPSETHVDIAFRFPDESIAIRIEATQRWEVWRTW